MYKRARIPMFLWERRACANSGAQPAQAVFPCPRKNGLGTRLPQSGVQRLAALLCQVASNRPLDRGGTTP